MNELEFDILDEMYFIISFSQLSDNLKLPASRLQAGLSSLLEKEYAGQYLFDDDAGDFVRLIKPDLARLGKYHYLATKEGLLAHNL